MAAIPLGPELDTDFRRWWLLSKELVFNFSSWEPCTLCTSLSAVRPSSHRPGCCSVRGQTLIASSCLFARWFTGVVSLSCHAWYFWQRTSREPTGKNTCGPPENRWSNPPTVCDQGLCSPTTPPWSVAAGSDCSVTWRVHGSCVLLYGEYCWPSHKPK